MTRPATHDVAPLDVLIVDDDPADVALIEEAFGAHDAEHRLHHVADGVEALAFLRREPPYADASRPDLILLDLNMPRVDGRQVLAEVKSDARLKAIPVIVFTTSAAVTDILDSYGAHANAYITKPIDLDQFDRTITEIRRFYGTAVTLPRRNI